MTNKRINYEITAKDKTAAAFKSVRQSVNQLAKVGAVAGAAFGTAFVAAYSKAAVDVDKLAKTASKLGVGTEQLAGLRHAAELTGVSVETADMALQRMTRRVAEAAQGTGEAVKALDELNIDAEKLVDLPIDEQFAIISDAMAGVENQADRVRLAMKLFDSEGVSLVNTMALGSAGLRDAAEEARMFGVAISSIDAGQVEAANDEMTRVKRIFEGVSTQIAVQFAPIVGALTNKFIESINAAGGVGQVTANMANTASKAIGHVANFVRGLEVAWFGVKLAVAQVSNSIVQMYGNIASFGGGIAEKLGFDSEGLENIAAFAASYQHTVDGMAKDLQDKLLAPMPSEEVEAYVSDFTAKWQEAIQNKANEGALNIPIVPSSAALGEGETNEDNQSELDVEKEKYKKLNNLMDDYVGNVVRGQDTIASGAKKAAAQQLANHIKAKVAESKASGAAAIAQAWASAPFPANLIPVGITTAKTLAITAAIQGLSAASFEGGGYTPKGVRAGGLDGKGGRMAMLHPNEKITDLEKSGEQSGGVYNININAVDARSFKQLAGQDPQFFANMINSLRKQQGKEAIA